MENLRDIFSMGKSEDASNGSRDMMDTQAT